MAKVREHHAANPERYEGMSEIDVAELYSKSSSAAKRKFELYIMSGGAE